MKLVLTTAVLLCSLQSFATTDFGCVNRCTQAGNLYGLCQSRCSYNTGGGVDTSMYQQGYQYQPQAQPVKQTDWGCVNRCTSNGNQWGLCKSQCSY